MLSDDHSGKIRKCLDSASDPAGLHLHLVLESGLTPPKLTTVFANVESVPIPTCCKRDIVPSSSVLETPHPFKHIHGPRRLWFLKSTTSLGLSQYYQRETILLAWSTSLSGQCLSLQVLFLYHFQRGDHFEQGKPSFSSSSINDRVVQNLNKGQPSQPIYRE